MMKPYKAVSISGAAVVFCLILLTLQSPTTAAPSNSSEEQFSTHKSEEIGVLFIWSVPFGKNLSQSNDSLEQDSSTEKIGSSDQSQGSGSVVTSSSRLFRFRKSLNDSATPTPPAGIKISGNSTGLNSTHAPHHKNSTVRFKHLRRNSSAKKHGGNSTTIVHKNSTTGSNATTTTTSTVSINANSVAPTGKPLNRTRREVDVVILDNPSPPAVLIFEFNATSRPDDNDSNFSNETNSNSNSEEHVVHYNAHGPTPARLRHFPNSSEEIQPLNSNLDLNLRADTERKRRDLLFFDIFQRINLNNTNNNTALNSDEEVSAEESTENGALNGTAWIFSRLIIEVFPINRTANASSEENSAERNNSKNLVPSNDSFTDFDDTIQRRKRQAVGYGSLDDSVSMGRALPEPPIAAALSPSSGSVGSATESTTPLSGLTQASGSFSSAAGLTTTGATAPTFVGDLTSSASNTSSYTTLNSTSSCTNNSSVGAGASVTSSSATIASASATTNASSFVVSENSTMTPSPSTSVSSAGTPVAVTQTASSGSPGSTTLSTTTVGNTVTNSTLATTGAAGSTLEATATSGTNSNSTSAGAPDALAAGAEIPTATMTPATLVAGNSSSTFSSIMTNTSGSTGAGRPIGNSTVVVSAPAADSFNPTSRADLANVNAYFGSQSPQTAYSSMGDGKYQFAYEVSDPTMKEFFSQQESSEGNVTKGSYQVLLPDGRTEIVNYTADSGGYHPKIEFQGAENPASGFAAARR